MDTPLFSIVIANYNYGRFIGDAIQSVFSQNEDGVELIVVDGCSADDSIDRIKELAGRELRVEAVDDVKGHHKWHICEKLTWLSERDGGQSDAFNKGFSRATGRFLTWLNADDVFCPGALNAIHREISRRPGKEWFVGSTLWLDKDLRVKRVFRAHRFSRLRMRYGHASASGPSSFFSKRLLNSVGGVDESLHYVMDIDLWSKFYLLAGVKYYRTTADVWGYRIHEDSKMSGADVSRDEKALRNRERSRMEGEEMKKRYPRPSSLVIKRFVDLLSFSLVDKIFASWRTCRCQGKRFDEI